MNKWRLSIAAAAAGLALCVASLAPAQALTSKECSVKYKAAKSAGTLNGMKWKDFRKAQCGAQASATPAAQPAAASANPLKPSRRHARAAPSAAPTSSSAVFPTAVSPKYSKESAGKARMHTCLDQYKANKASNGNGGLKWIQKGGGYYSQCTKRLKGG